MTQGVVLAAGHDGWGELVLNRPERRNALAPDSAAALRLGLAELVAGGARVILLRGEGGTFCSGLDVDLFRGGAGAAWAGDWAGFHRDLHACPAVVICALERYAINAGASCPDVLVDEVMDALLNLLGTEADFEAALAGQRAAQVLQALRHGGMVGAAPVLTAGQGLPGQ